ncbi:MAG: FMN-binding protein [Candidatus Delongbacteria bacterium]|nr:FMN-binding protein [Candidatus Delongbacteria bacterium]MBN2833476.1 FMN-binding protein [Candidatus Delongbacteria bacterium]
MKKITPIIFIIAALMELLSFDRADVSDSKFKSLSEKYLDTDNYIYVSNEKYRFSYIDENKDRRFFILTSDYFKDFGYEGYTNLAIVFNNKKEIEELKIYKSSDTKSYVRKIQFSSFPKKLASYRSGDEIDCITSATVTCKVMISTVEKCYFLMDSIFNVENSNVVNSKIIGIAK